MSITVNDFTGALGRIEAGGTGTTVVNKLNAPLVAAENALNTLATRIANISNKSAIIRKYVPLYSTTANPIFVGALVYYDAENGCFSKALAELSATPGANGASIETEKARVEGIVLQLDTGTVDTSDSSSNTGTVDTSDSSSNAGTVSNTVLGTVMLGGYWEDINVANGCLGNGAAAGTYYLSPTTAGTAVSDPGEHLRQPIITYHGGGKMNLSIYCMAHDNHFHGSCLLQRAWTSKSNPPTGITVPTGATYWYDHTQDANFTGLGDMSQSITAVFYDGVLQAQDGSGAFCISGGYLWYKGGQTPPTVGKTTVFNHYPFAYGSAVVRSVESYNDALTVTTRNGRVIITQNDFTDGSVVKSPVAISSIVGRSIGYTSVVSGLAAGYGVTIASAADGVHTISASSKIGALIDAYSINYNGAAPVSDGTFVYITFPKGRGGSIVISAPVEDVPTGTTLTGYVWGQCVGSGATFTVTGYYVPSPTLNTPVEFSTTGTNLGNLVFSGQSGYLSRSDTNTGIAISGNGYVHAKITLSGTSTSDVRLLRVGFRLEVATSTTTTATSSETTTVTAVVNARTASCAMSAFTCVMIDANGQLAVCSAGASSINCANRVVGVTKEASTGAGDSVLYVSSGLISNAGSGLTPGAPIYVGTSGQITQVAPLSTTPAGSFNQRIGTALTSTDVQIEIEPAVIQE